MTETSTDNRTISRRKTLRVIAGALTAGVAFPRVASAEGDEAITAPESKPAQRLVLGQISKAEDLTMQPEVVRGTEVYGLAGKISTAEQVINLYQNLDNKFQGKQTNSFAGNKLEQRGVLLNAKERYLEVVVRQSAYDSFLTRRGETKADFVEWVKMHVDALNTVIFGTNPKVDMRAILRRIVVVDDKMPASFWDEASYKAQVPDAEALDRVWAIKFNRDHYPVDIDCSWAISDDYRTPDKMANGWTFVHNGNGTITFKQITRPEVVGKNYTFAAKNDSLVGKDGTWLDFDLIHEWSHYLLNLPDQDAFNIDNPNITRFRFFHFVTGTNFQEPYMSAYLAMFLDANTKRPARSLYQQTMANRFSERPATNRLVVTDATGVVNEVKIHRVALNADNDYRGEKQFKVEADQVRSGNNVVVSPKLYDERVSGGDRIWWIRASVNGQERQLLFPALFLQMSKFAGVNNGNYFIEFTGHEDIGKKMQILDLVDESDYTNYIGQKAKEGLTPYARMKVDGTKTWTVWFIKDIEFAYDDSPKVKHNLGLQ